MIRHVSFLTDIRSIAITDRRAVAKKWEKLKIVGHESILEKSYALAHLPSDKIQEGLKHITALIDNLNDEKLVRFGTYMRNQWGPLKNILSIYQNPVRTNNTCENFHMHAKRRIGKHETVWKMLNGLKEVIEDIGIKYDNVCKGFTPKCWRPMNLQLTDTAILNFEREFGNGRTSVEEFMFQIASLKRIHLSRVYDYELMPNAPEDERRQRNRAVEQPHVAPVRAAPKRAAPKRTAPKRAARAAPVAPVAPAKPAERRKRGRPRIKNIDRLNQGVPPGLNNNEGNAINAVKLVPGVLNNAVEPVVQEDEVVVHHDDQNSLHDQQIDTQEPPLVQKIDEHQRPMNVNEEVPGTDHHDDQNTMHDQQKDIQVPPLVQEIDEHQRSMHVNEEVPCADIFFGVLDFEECSDSPCLFRENNPKMYSSAGASARKRKMTNDIIEPEDRRNHADANCTPSKPSAKKKRRRKPKQSLHNS
ncbi:hypothetical protein TKK_0016540 [Trichogramma kaykai]